MKNYENYKRMYDWKKPSCRTWPDKEITKAPIWCSVDLRDGNQALATPMSLQEKIEFFDHLVSIGFKEIEIGFPAASETEFQFTRYLIENNKIPDDVTIQVISQAREDILSKTFESLVGAKRVIVNIYNSISKIQREVVFNKSKDEVKQIAISAANFMIEYVKAHPETDWHFEYTPESFTNAEVDYSIDVINSILDVWKNKISNKPIINLTATVECSTPNIFADQVEYVCERINNREDVIISIHTHNDRGTSVATSEMGLLAGADRIEGTLFGNGERTGNSDLMNIAMNMYVTGVDPKLDFSHINQTRRIFEKCTKMKVSPRHPYAGELVFTSFSGSHQDAISKGLKHLSENNSEKYWEMPYLPINPKDIHRHYEPIIRINSQSGKAGIAFILESQFGYNIPRNMQKEIGVFFKDLSDKLHKELTIDEIHSYFVKEFINREDIVKVESYDIQNINNNTSLDIIYSINNNQKKNKKIGIGPIDAFVDILIDEGYQFKILDYIQESLNENGEKSQAVSYINIKVKDNDFWAIGQDSDITKSGLKAVVSALNRINNT